MNDVHLDDSFESFLNYMSGKEAMEKSEKATIQILAARWFSVSDFSILSKDVVKIIAKLVWDSRYNKNEWV